MEKTIEQWQQFVFAGKLVKTFEMIQKVNGESTVHHATVFRWYNMYSEGGELIRDEQRSGRPTMIRTHKNIAHIADILKEDRWSLCRLIVERMGIPTTILQQILREDLQNWKLCAQFVPHALIAKQKEERLNHTYNLIEMIKSNPNFLDSIITGYERWCFAYDPETKRQSFEWCSLNTRPSKKFRFQKSKVKMMLIFFLTAKSP